MKLRLAVIRFSWLLAPIGVCLVLVLGALLTLQAVYNRSLGGAVPPPAQSERMAAPVSAAAQPAAAGRAEPVPALAQAAWTASAAAAQPADAPLADIYRAARNLILALGAGAVALLVWLTLRMGRNRKRLAEREALYHQVLDHLPLMVRIRDLNGQVKFENQATRMSDVVARWGSMDLQRATSAADLPPLSRRIWEAQRDALRSGAPQERRFESGDLKQSDYRAYRLISFPIYDVYGLPQALGSLALDETEQTRDRYALAELATDLEKQVEQRTVELVAAKEQAEAATQAKANFLANMSHEIRSPLNALVGLSHLAKRSNREPRLESYLDKILKSAEHLQDVVGDILDFSKIEAGEMRIERVPFSLQRLLDSVIDIVWERARDKPLQLILDVDPHLAGHFYGDPLRIVQILINFMDNAIKFTERGSISLRVLLGDAQGERQELHFEIQDSGVGIPAEQLEEIFKPFYQVDDSITRRYGGTGLGLVICAQLTELLGGQLSVQSQQGVGSLFRLSLSLDIAPDTEQMAELAGGAGEGSDALSLQGRHVLLVEDDPLNREVGTEQLTVLGVRVSCAVNGAEALQWLADDSSIELVLMDVQMPVMDGLEAVRTLRPLYPALPVIALTANNLPGDRERFLQAGMSDYLAKPVDPMRLEALLERWLCRVSEPRSFEVPAQPPEKALGPVPGLNQEAALSRLLNNHGLYLKLLTRFVEDHAGVSKALHACLAGGQVEQALEELHRFKSLAGTLGAETLQSLSIELELCLREGRAWSVSYQRFAAEFDQVLQAVRQALASGRAE